MPGTETACALKNRMTVLKGQLLNFLFPSTRTMRQVLQAVDEVKSRFTEPLVCLETGTIRSYEENHRSTLRIAERLGERGRLVSVDISPDSIRVSRDLCQGLSNIQWIESDSLTFLKSLKGPLLHFAFLDSVNDASVILEEFRLTVRLMVPGGTIMVDDAGILTGGRGRDLGSSAVKGHGVYELLRTREVPFKVLPTVWFHGNQLKIEVSSEVQAKIMESEV